AAREGGKMFHRDDDEGVGKDSHNNRRYAIQQVRRIPDNECPGGSSELCQIDAADKPNWDADQTRKTQQFGTSKNRIGKSTACFPNWSRQFCKEVPIQRSSALPHEVTQYEEKDRDGNQRANSRHRKHDEVRGSSPDSMRHHDCADAFLVM